MYKSDYCEVNYDKKHNVVFVKWKKFCCNQDYREPLEYALDIIKQHENCDYVADTRSGFENIPEDTQWVADYFMPKAVEYGCKCIYFIIDKKNSLKEELEGQEKDSSDKIQFKYIYSLEEIEVFREINILMILYYFTKKDGSVLCTYGVAYKKITFICKKCWNFRAFSTCKKALT